MLKLETNWEFVADTVMGGISSGRIANQVVDGRSATQLTGMVSLENNGGFIQMASDLKRDGSGLDVSNWVGAEIDVCGNDEIYDLRIRTDDLERPWQSFRAPFRAPAQWTTVRLPFPVFEPHRTDNVLDPAKLRRIGIVAVGRVFQADIAVSDVRLF
jgi:hypothetical protein